MSYMNPAAYMAQPSIGQRIVYLVTSVNCLGEVRTEKCYTQSDAHNQKINAEVRGWKSTITEVIM